MDRILRISDLTMRRLAFAILIWLASACGAFAQVTLDSSKKSADITLSNGSLTATTGTANTYNNALATNASNSGKVYWEFQVNTANTNSQIGWADASFSHTDFLGDGGTDSWGLDSSSGTLFAGGNCSLMTAGQTGSNWVGIAVDWSGGSTAPNIWVTYNGSTWNTGLAGTQNPSTGAGGTTPNGCGGVSPTSGTYYPAIELGSSMQETVNFGCTAFAYTIPTGFSAITSCSAPGTTTRLGPTCPNLAAAICRPIGK